MKFYVLTLFPDMIKQGMQTSILGRAVENGKISLRAVDIRAYTTNKHKKVDDYPYGGGAGMLMQAQPIYDCYQDILSETGAPEQKKRVIYLTPQGKRFDQKLAEELAREDELIFLCGHYEGVDERVLEEIVTDYVSIGDYVLTGGELPAMVVMDAVARLVTGVLHNETSAEFESFHNDLLEYPHYSRPEEWHGKRVPAVLLSGNHDKITKWRVEQSIARTRQRRPDLYDQYEKRLNLVQKLNKKNKLLYTDMTESLKRGECLILYEEADGVILYDEKGAIYLLALFQEENAKHIADALPFLTKKEKLVVHHEALLAPLSERFLVHSTLPCVLAVYTERTCKSVPGILEYRMLGLDSLDAVLAHYGMASDAYIKERIAQGDLFGGYLEGVLVGFVGIHKEGSMGMLEVFGEYQRRGFGAALEAYAVNHQLSRGKVPYANIAEGNCVSLKLQEKAGLYIAKGNLFWLDVTEKKLALHGEL